MCGCSLELIWGFLRKKTAQKSKTTRYVVLSLFYFPVTIPSYSSALRGNKKGEGSAKGNAQFDRTGFKNIHSFYSTKKPIP